MKIDIVICTYNRQDFLKNNLEILSKKCKKFINKVFVIDNASNLPKTLSNNFIKIIHNNNLGGSGGYARGFYEVSKDKECTHIMLMDDDIKFAPEAIEKAYLKLKQCKPEDWLGFGMATFDKPNKLFEAGAKWNGIKVRRNNKNFSLNCNKELKNNECNYSGWWSIIMPVNVIQKYGYPFPFFIKFDDVEYGLRREAEKIFFDKNVFVQHESFKNKKSSVIRYYNIRNGLITNALHFKHNALLSTLQYLAKIIKFYFTFKYNDINATNFGVSDYLKGPEILTDSNLNLKHNEIKNKCNKKVSTFMSFLATPFVALFYAIKILNKNKELKNKYLGQYKYLTSAQYWEAQFNQ